MGITSFQAGQYGAEPHIALFKIRHRSQHLLIGRRATHLFQLLCQLRQLVGVGGVVVYHILHQSHQFLHGGVLTLGGAAAALTAAVMAVVMVMTLTVEMVVAVRMGVLMVVNMVVGVGMGHTVMGVLMGMLMAMVVGMTHMIVMNMHNITP